MKKIDNFNKSLAQSGHHMDYLDGLRGVAAFIVVISHFVVGFYPTLFDGIDSRAHVRNSIEVIISKSPLNIIYSGNLAVCVFFVLSGYVLTYKFFQRKDQRILISGAFRRYIRIFLPAFTSILVAYFLMVAGLFFNRQASVITRSDIWLDNLWKFKPDLLIAIKQAVFDIFFTSYLPTYNIVLWTISYEFIGSLLVFVLVAILGNQRFRFIPYLLVIVLLFDSYYGAFVLGVILADLYNNDKKPFALDFINRIPGILLLLAGLFFGSYPIEVDVKGTFYEQMKLVFLKNPAIQYHVLGSFFIMLALLNSRKLQEFFSTKSMVFLGKISFSSYLLHLILMCSMSCYLFIHLHSFLSYHLSVAISFIMTVPVLLTLSWIMYRLIDLNSVKLSHLLYKSIFAKILPSVSQKISE